MRHSVLLRLAIPLALLACGAGGEATVGESSAGESYVGGKITLPSGLGIEDLVVGSGDEALAGSRITTHVDGTFSDGTKFWSNRDSPQTARGFTAALRGGRGGVIEGWVLGVPGMREGGKRRLHIPWKLAYGKRGNPPTIPPEADLVFEIELLEVH